MRRPRTENKFNSFYFDRYLYNAMRQPVAPDYLKHLSGDDRDHLVEPDMFISDASLEEKLLLLQRLGHVFAVVIGAPQKEPSATYQGRLITWFFKALAWRKYRCLQVFRDKLLFVLCDTEFLKGLKLASSICNSPAAATYAGYGAIANRMYQYRYEASKNMMRDVTAGKEIDEVIVSAIAVAQVDNVREGFKNLYGIDEKQFVLLSLLSRHKQLTGKEMKEKTRFRWLPTQLELLVERKLADRRELHQQYNTGRKVTHIYWITGLGEQTLLRARNYFIQHL